MTVIVRIRGTDKETEIEDVVNFKMDTAHFWLKLKGDNYKTFWRRNVELVRIKDSEVKEENAKQIEQIADLKNYCCEVSKYLHDNSVARPDASAYKKRDALLIEELKEKLESSEKIRDYWKESAFDWRHKFFEKRSTKRLVKKSKQLTKARGLLNEFMRISKAIDEDFDNDYSELIGETETFLKEVSE